MTERILTPEEYAKLMDDCVDDCIAVNKIHLPLLAHDKILREVNEEMKDYIKELQERDLAMLREVKMWQEEVNKLEDERKSYDAADAHRMFWELKTEKALLVLKSISEMHCYRKKLGSPCHKALPNEEWCAVCVARSYMKKEGNPWGRPDPEST